MAAENFKVKKGLEVGTGITANSDGIDVTGIITATQFKGDGSGLIGVVASGTGVVVKDEGSTVGTAGTINFVGDGVAATLSAGTATVTINAGALDNVVEDTTPELGGDLNLNSKYITGSGGINVTGVVTATTLKGNGDFVDIDVDGQTEVDDLNVAGVSTFTGTITAATINGTGGNFSGNLKFSNNVGTLFGASDELQIYHNSGTSRIEHNGTGALELKSKTGADGIQIIREGAVKLYHDGNQKLTTPVNGIEVPDLNVTGVGTVGRLDTDGVVLGTNATTFAAKFADDAVANFGTGNDLQIYMDGDNSYIDEVGSGNLNLRGSTVILGKPSSTAAMLKAVPDAEVNLYFNGINRLKTADGGVIMTGVATATSFSGSAAGLTNIPSAQLSGALPSLDGSALTGVTASGTGIVIQHDGSNVGTAGTINFSTNLDVSPVSAGIVTVTASGGGGGSQNLFSTIAVSGQSNIVADGTTDTLTFAEGSNITLTTNAGTDTITITSEQLTTEEVQDIVGAMFTSNTETDITATYQDDDGTIDLVVDLSSLNASNLDSGTIPSGRFPATLPATSGANLTALNASEITSGTLPIARIADNAVTFAKMQDVGTGVLIGRNNSGSGDMETLSASEVRTLLNVADGATAGGDDPADTDPQVVFDIAGGAGSGYTFTGPGNDGSTGNPDIYLQRGQRYRFINTTGSSHPFEFRNAANTADYTDGITGSQSGTQDFNVQYDAPGQLKYRCTIHTGSMQGNIYIRGANGQNANVGITTFSGAVTAPSFSGSGASLTNVSADTVDIGTANANQNYYPVFTETSGSSKTVNIDGGNNLTYNPGTNTLTAGTFSGSGSSLTGLTASQIPNLAASKITSGTFDAARIPTLNQNTTGNAGTFTVSANNSNNETVYPVFVDGATGSQGAETDTALTYNPSTNVLTTGTIDVGNANISSGITTISSAGNVDTTASGSCSAIEYTIYASHSSGIQSQKVLVMDNGSTAYANEFAVMFSSSLLISFSADLVGAAVRLRGTPESGISGNISIKFIKTIIE